VDRLTGKVALITGAARGQGRSHAVRFAAEGADIIAIDLCADDDVVSYKLSRPSDLEDTERLVRETGRRIVAVQGDVREPKSLEKAVTQGVEQFGRLDVVCANAGISTGQAWSSITPHLWDQIIATNLTGVWNTFQVAIPHLLNNGGGSMIATGSTAGVKGLPFFTPYTASKFGVVGLVKSLANELAPHFIRVNVVHPTGVATAMRDGLFDSGLGKVIATNDRAGSIYMNALPVEAVEASDITNAMLYLASDESRYVTGSELYVDAGNLSR
jgi:SDR family mycofactocin-dependent oxidoreductase